MTSIQALDVAVLLPPEAAHVVERLSASLPHEDFRGLRLDVDHVPHITLAQFFGDISRLEDLLAAIADAVSQFAPVPLGAPRCTAHGSTVWLEIEPASRLQALHGRIMTAILPFESDQGDKRAFVGGDARPEDVQWVAGYRGKASGALYTPHVTVGHSSTLPSVRPFAFTVTDIAVCRLGRFCTCRSVLRGWVLSPPSRSV